MTPRTPSKKVLTRAELVVRFGLGREGTLVFTNGCFEILHAGHVSYLAEARKLGDALVVGVNSDASARRLGKGAGRPFVGESDRALLVASLESVDAVCLFDEDTPAEMIAALGPDVLVKGGDYAPDQVAGKEAVLGRGGRVVIIPFVSGHSTSDLLKRIEGAGGGSDG